MADDNKDYTKSNIAADQKEEDARSSANNANNIRNAADVAIATKNGYAVAIGTAVKAADKITGGKSTEALGKGMTLSNKFTPGGKRIQNMSNKLNESGLSDKVGTAARVKNGMGGGASGAAGKAADADKAMDAAKTAETAKKANDAKKAGEAAKQVEKNKKGGESHSSSSSSNKDHIANDTSGDSSESKKGGLASFLIKHIALSFLFMFFPFILLFLVVFTAVAVAAGVFGDYDDAFGMSYTLGEESGVLEYVATSDEQQEFFNRVNTVKLRFQAEGKSVDALKIVAIYHVLKTNNANIDYDNVTDSTITYWANSMFNNGSYDEEFFKSNLANSIIPSYLNVDDLTKKALAEDVIKYVENYHDLVGDNNRNTSSCSSIGSCTYDISGFYNNGTVYNVNISVSNLKVRLMQCGSPFGTGSYTTPINNDLVDFEDYIAGVAYAEVGDQCPIEQYKTQMVAARSFALSRPATMGNARGLKLEQENGQWILQISSCVADQVFCDIDKGCHTTPGQQGGYVVPGPDSSGKFYKPALPAEHDIRKAAAETQGEVLVNNQGNIVHCGYLSTEQNMWRSLANQGYDYKQILLKTYKNGSRGSGATDIKKYSCNGSGGVCASDGDYASWRQTDAQWGSIPMGDSGFNISQIGCLVTSISIQIARSGVQTNINPFNPGTFVQFLNNNNGFASGGNFLWASAQKVAPNFVYQNQISLSGMSKEQKLNTIKQYVNQSGVYVVAEVLGNTGQHWVAIESVEGDNIKMVDPSSDSKIMWERYNWANTSKIVYYKVN